jgi:gliding motility-associated-like protein
MLKNLCYFLVLFSCLSFSQTITVDDTNYSETQLANLLLNGSCVDPTNVSYSDALSVAQFDGNGSAFPLTEGIIIRTGIAKHTEGIYTGLNMSSQVNNNSDPDLQTISNSTGQTDPVTDTAFLQFDFVPISSDFSFNFVFASNEYGQWQCGFSDVFAFLLTDSSGTTTNLAIIPGTTDPITVSTIRDNTYNGGCTSENASLFSTYNVDAPASSTLNMRGHTSVLNASSTLTPGETYTIRLVIADYKNATFDSAVFIDTGSFTTEIDLGEDTSICTGNSIDITTSLDVADYDHSWTLNGNIIVGAADNTLTITQAGTYSVIAMKNGTACQIPGTITITDLVIGTPNNLTVCNDGSATFNYDLSSNDESVLGLNPAIYDVIYFATPTDITNDTPITGSDITQYSVDAVDTPDTIYIKILNIATNTYCTAQLEFQLTLSDTVTATEPNDIVVCESSTTTTVDLTIQNSTILNGSNATDFNITYYASQADLDNQNPIGNSIDIPAGSATQEIFVLMTSSSNSNCFDTTSFNITINPLPEVATLNDVLECTNYTLPPIDDVNGDGTPDGVYYDAPDGPNGIGTQLSVGDLIEDGGILYIHVGPDANGCYNESSFTLTFIDEYEPDLYNCDEFVIPSFPPGDFFSASGGNGTLLATGTTYNSTTIPSSIYYYAELTDPVTGVTSVCLDQEYNITVYDLPPVDTLTDVVTCDSYTLEPLTNGAYYNSPNGVAPIINLTLTSSQTVYIFNTETHNSGTPEEITCSSPNSSFEVTIINDPADVQACDTYNLPTLNQGGYFEGPNGTGNPIAAGTLYTYDPASPVNNMYDIYVYTVTTPTDPPTANCSDNYMFTLTVNVTPEVDSLGDENNEIKNCINAPYILPTPTNGAYFDGPGGPTIANSIAPLTAINTVGFHTIYIYNEVNGCPAESSFTVEIRDLPLTDNFTDVYECDPYILPSLANGNYFNSTGGINDPNFSTYEAGNMVGSEILPGTIANEAISVYIYNEWDDITGCAAETVFTVYVLGINLGIFDDENHCDSYTLPPLAVGNYFTEQQLGVPPSTTIQQLNAGDIITSTQTIFVYAENGIPERDPALCKAEESFLVTISNTPILTSFTNEVVCGEFQLPATSTISTTYDVNYYTASGGNAADIINPVTPITIPEGESSPYTTTVYIHATATGNTACFDFDSFTITIYERPNFTVSDTVICVDPETGIVAPENYVLLESVINPSQFTVNWYLNEGLVHTGANYYAEQPGEYTVETVMIAAETPPNCNYNSTTVTVLESSTAIATYSVTEDFEDTATITVAITNGSGTYQYQLDDGPFQNSNVFHNVLSGDHIVTILDIYGNCGTFKLPVFILKYPKFFTPNGDGINDTWNIRNLFNQPDSKINIFDRFGKFIVQITPSGKGWNGTYNNSQLPSTDYWFVVFYKGRNGEDKEFKAHFSLKR